MIWIIINIVFATLGLIILTLPKWKDRKKAIIWGIVLTILGNIAAYIKSEIDSSNEIREFNISKATQERKYDSLIQLSNSISAISTEILFNSRSPILYNYLDSLLEEHERTTKKVTQIKLLDVRTFIYEHSETVNDFPTTQRGIFMLISILNKNSTTTVNNLRIKGKIYLNSIDMEIIYSHHPDDPIAKNKLWNNYAPYIIIDLIAYPDRRTKKYLQPNEKALLFYTIMEPSYGGYTSIKPDQIGFEGFKEPSKTRSIVYPELLFKYPLNKQLPYYQNYPFDVRYKDEYYKNTASIYLDTDNGLIKIEPRKLYFFDKLNKDELENNSFEKMIQYWKQ